MDEEWDVFISHAYEDKDDVARPLALALQAAGLKVWFDELSLRVGDSLTRSINEGIARSGYGIVILSRHFLSKKWTQDELGGILAREEITRRILLPVWHGVSAAELRERAPLLADRVAARWADGVDTVVQQLLDAMILTARGITVGGDWIGRTGRLRLRQIGTIVRGDYDWNELAWAGHLHGELLGNIFRFAWAWSGGVERGRGYFIHGDARLRGGWVFDDDVVDINTLPLEQLEQHVNTWEFWRDDPVSRVYRHPLAIKSR